MAVHRIGTVIQNDTFDTSTPNTSSLWGAWTTRMHQVGYNSYPHSCAYSSNQDWETDGALLLPSPNQHNSGWNGLWTE